MPLKVYVSDTSSELEDLREVVFEQITDAGMTPLEIDEDEREEGNLLETARRKIAEADFFISIVTYKRAWQRKTGDNQSLQEIEYDLARESNKPAVVLLPQDNSAMGMFLRARSLAQSPTDTLRQQQFWKRLTAGGNVRYFSDEADLAKQISQILRRWSSSEATPPAAAPLSPTQQNLIPDTVAEIDLLADRVAQKVEAIQQRRQEDLADKAVKVNEALRLLPGELVFGRPSTARQFKSDAFMIMSFAASLSGIYADIIKPLMTELKLTITRGDEFNSTRGVIMEEVWAALNACRFVIAEISGGNDNVFYELGIAHTLNKPAILITQSKTPDEIPFDVRHLRYIRYENTAAGGAKLRDDLQVAITRLLTDLNESWGNGASG